MFPLRKPSKRSLDNKEDHLKVAANYPDNRYIYALLITNAFSLLKYLACLFIGSNAVEIFSKLN